MSSPASLPPVDKAGLEASLANLRTVISDPVAGIHGPHTTAWRLDRELAVFLGGGRAALMQLAHPKVAYAIAHHSSTRADVVGRFRRTFENVFAMGFGDFDSACFAARRVHAVHGRIRGALDEAVGPWPRGERYEANDPRSLLWVYATLVDTVMQVSDGIFGPLPEATKDAYLRDTHRFAALFAIPPALLPATWREFAAYVDHMVLHELAVAPPARDMATFLLGRGEGRGQPVMARGIEHLTAALLPPPLAVQFGLAPATAEARRRLLRRIARPYKAIPDRIRVIPAYLAAECRLAGKPVPAWSSWLEARLFALVERAVGAPG